MDKFEQKELKKIIELKNTLYDLLITFLSLYEKMYMVSKIKL